MDKIALWARLRKNAPVALLTFLFVLLFILVVGTGWNGDQERFANIKTSFSPAGMGGGTADEEFGGVYYDETYSFVPGEDSESLPEVMTANEYEKTGSNLSMPSPLPPVGGGSAGAALPDRKIVKNGSLSLVVENVENAIARVKVLASEQNGHVESIVYDNTGNFAKKRATVTLRVPADKFDVAVEAMKGFAVKVERENVSASDVTSQFVDIEARLENLRAEEKQYQGIMEDAVKIPDILQVSRQLFAVRQQIEQLEAWKANLTGETDMSSITATLSSEPDVDPVPTEWKPWTTAKQAFAALLSAFARLADVIIFLIILMLPLLLLIGVILALVLRVLWKILLAIKRKVDVVVPVSHSRPASPAVPSPARRAPRTPKTPAPSQNDGNMV